jgi:hypothetical protein
MISDLFFFRRCWCCHQQHTAYHTWVFMGVFQPPYPHRVIARYEATSTRQSRRTWVFMGILE